MANSPSNCRASSGPPALQAGDDPLNAARITRHRDRKTLRVYDRRAKLFNDHAGKDSK
jgi:hypothetical protein